MGQSIETKINANVTQLYNVNNSSSNSTSLDHQVKRLQMTMESPMAGTQTFDSDNPKDLESDAGKSLGKALNSKYSMTLDATGKVVSVKTDDPKAQTAQADENDPMAGMLSQLAQGLDAPKAGDKSAFKILPDKEISKGDNWTDSTLAGLATYTVSDINDTAIIITYAANGGMQKKQEMMGQEITINTKDTTTGTIVLDKKTRLLKTNTSTTESKGTMEVMGQSIPMNTKTMRTITVKES
jgi:hypothetical protein